MSKKEKETKTVHPLRAMRKAGVPLVAWHSPDPAATVAECCKELKPKEGEPDFAIFQWDRVSELTALNKPGASAIDYVIGSDPLQGTMDMLKRLQKLSDWRDGDNDKGKRALVFLHQMDRFFTYDPTDGVVQGVLLLRDRFKALGATLVFFWQGGTLPPELKHDVMEVSEVAPTVEAILEVCDAVSNDTKPKPEWDREVVADALKGLLSRFDVEQTFALSLSRAGVNVRSIQERKIKRLKGSTGADVVIDNPKFADVSGCANVKSELSAFIRGKQKPGVVLFMDEIEKMFSGAGTDLSGTTTNMLGQWLTWTQERRARGFLLAGIPGAGKSLTAAAAAGEAGIPLFKLNVSETKGSLVGQSEQQMKNALAAVDAISGGHVLMIASCNWVDSMPPDLMARFTMGTFFYDFPDETERQSLLELYAKKYELAINLVKWLSITHGWVGREIENACFKASQFSQTFEQVAGNVVPSVKSQAKRLDDLRRSCSGRFVSASHAGPYQYKDLPVQERTPAKVAAIVNGRNIEA